MLTKKLEAWVSQKKALNSLEDEIKEEILALQTSIAHGEAQAKFVKGATKCDYELVVAQEKSPNKKDLIKKHSTEKVTVKWKSVVDDLGVPSERLEPFKTTGEPKVTLTLVPKS